MANTQFIMTQCIVEINVEYFYSYQYIIDNLANCVKQNINNRGNLKVISMPVASLGTAGVFVGDMIQAHRAGV